MIKQITENIFLSEDYNWGYGIKVLVVGNKVSFDDHIKNRINIYRFNGEWYDKTEVVYKFNNPVERLDVPLLFSLKNVVKYYKWHILNRLFWEASARETPSLGLLLKYKDEKFEFGKLAKIRGIMRKPDMWKYWVFRKISNFIKTHSKLNDVPYGI